MPTAIPTIAPHFSRRGSVGVLGGGVSVGVLIIQQCQRLAKVAMMALTIASGANCAASKEAEEANAARSDSIRVLAGRYAADSLRLAQAALAEAISDTLWQGLSQVGALLDSAHLLRLRSLHPGADLEASELTATSEKIELVTGGVRDVIRRMHELNGELSKARHINAAHVAANASLSSQLEFAERTLERYQERIAILERENLDLQASAREVESANLRLQSVADDQRRRVDSVIRDRDLRFYIVGTEAELEQAGIIDVHRRRILFVSREPQRFVRGMDDLFAREHAFVAVTAETRNIDLLSGRYRILSAHSLDAGGATPDAKKRFVGPLRLNNPRGFWSASRYLVILRET